MIDALPGRSAVLSAMANTDSNMHANCGLDSSLEQEREQELADEIKVDELDFQPPPLVGDEQLRRCS